MRIFGLTCDKATMICDKSQYKESTLWERIKLNVHFLQCKVCRLYTLQNNFISNLINRDKEAFCSKEINSLSDIEKETLRKELEKRASLNPDLF
jgi:hypothetical protein